MKILKCVLNKSLYIFVNMYFTMNLLCAQKAVLDVGWVLSTLSCWCLCNNKIIKKIKINLNKSQNLINLSNLYI